MNDLDTLFDLISESNDAELIDACLDLYQEKMKVDTLSNRTIMKEENRDKFYKILECYENDMKDAKKNIKSKDFKKARENLNDASKKLDEMINIIKSIDPSHLDTCLSWIIPKVRTILITFAVDRLTEFVINSTVRKGEEGVSINNIPQKVNIQFLANAINIYRAYEPGDDPVKVLNPARANLIVSLKNEQRKINTLIKKIEKREKKLSTSNTNESVNTYDSLVDAICEKFSNDEITADDAVLLIERAADKYLCGEVDSTEDNYTSESTEIYDSLVDAICEKFSNDEITADDAVLLIERAADKYL